MDQIYKTKWGVYIDLSKIIAMAEMTGYMHDSLHSDGIRIEFQLRENPIDYYFIHYSELITLEERDEWFKDILNAWQEYVKSAKN